MMPIIASPGAPSPHRPKCAGLVGAFFRFIFEIVILAAKVGIETWKIRSVLKKP